MDQVAKSPADGYTLVMADSTIAVNPSLKPLPYDTLNDFAPVSLLATAPVILMAHPKVPAKTLAEFVALAKASRASSTTPPAATARPRIWAANCSSSSPASTSCMCLTRALDRR